MAVRRVWLRALALPLLLLAAGAAASESAEGSPASVAGRGWVVWESNRTGAFRIWRRALSGGPATQLSPDEPGRDHCCAHLSPDGARLVYLSMPESGGKYANPETVGELRLVPVEGGPPRVLVAAARNYGGHRASAWWSDRELTYIDAAGDTRLLDLETGNSRLVADGPERGEGFVVDRTGRWATSATPTFSAVDPATGRVELLPTVGGCDAWLVGDGETGIFIAGSGGPLDAIELRTRRTRTLLAKHDPLLPADRGYVYFSMLSRDRSLLALAGSNDQHDHYHSDYDVLVLELDPETLLPWSRAARITSDPGVDRYPDVWRDPATAPRPPQPSRLDTGAQAPAVSERWPATRDGLVWRWRGAGDGAAGDDDRLTPTGAASFDQRGRLVLAGGSAAAAPRAASRVTAAIKASNTVSVELLLEPESLRPEAAGTLFALGSGARMRGILISQVGASIELRLRTGRSGRDGGEAITLGRLPGPGPHHLAFTYSPGRLNTYIDGERVASPPWIGDFFRLRAEALTVGAEAGESAGFRGALSHLAVFARELTGAEVAADARRALGDLAAPR